MTAADAARVDLSTSVASLALASPVATASGTAGHGTELSAYFPLSCLGALVVKSLSAEPWAGNPAPRVHPLPAGMLNSVGLQGPGIVAWRREHLPDLEQSGALVIVSVWGRTVAEYARAAELLEGLPSCVVAVEVNVSCPNVEAGGAMFAHSPEQTAAAVGAVARCGRPIAAKLTAGTPQLVAVAGAALQAGAESLVLVNTLPGMAIDLERRRPALGAGGGGMSGAPLHPVAVRAVYDCRAAYPMAGIWGVGGVARGIDAVELLLAGADAVQVGTATLADPRAPLRVRDELASWCAAHGVTAVRELVGAAQSGGARHGAPARQASRA